MNKKKKKIKKQRDKKAFRIFIILVGINFIAWKFYDIDTIGGDYSYFLYIFLIPLIFGLITLVYFKYNFLKEKFSEAKSISSKLGVTLLYLVQGFLFSYLTFCLISSIIWTTVNRNKVSTEKSKFINCSIDKLIQTNGRKSGRKSHLSFTFKDGTENLTISNDLYRKYKDSNLKDLKLSLEIKPGYCDYYLIQNWEIISK